MSKPYFRPQADVQSEFVPLASAIIQAQPVVLIGPEIKVFESDDASDRTFINYGAYDSTVDTDYDYAGLPVGGVVNLDSVKLVLEDVYAQYAQLTGSNVIERGTNSNEIAIGASGGNGFQAYDNGTTAYLRNAAFVARDVQVGDRVTVLGNSITLNSRITGFVNDVVAAVVGQPANDTSNNPVTQALSTSVGVVSVAGTDHVVTVNSATTTYKGWLAKGVLNDVYTLEVTTAGAPATAKFKVTSTQGDNVAEVTSVSFGTAFDVGTRGLRGSVASTGSQAFVVGEKYTFTVAALYTRQGAVRTTSVSTYDGAFNTTYVIEVIRGGLWAELPQVIVTTSTGIDQGGPITVAFNTAFALGELGIGVKFGNVLSCTTTSASTSATTADTTGLVAGMKVTGTGIAANTTIASVTNGTTFVLSQNATASATNSLTFDTAQGGLLLGDKYTVAATASKKGAVKTALLAHPIDSSISAGDDLTVTFFIYKLSLDIPARGYPEFGDENLTAAADKFTVGAGITILDPTWFASDGVTPEAIPVKKATLIVPYNAILTATANLLQTLSDESSIPTIAGKVIPANPIGFGLSKALQNSGGQAVHFIRVETDDIEGYRAALGEHQVKDVGYFVVPLTQDDAILDLVRSHVDSLNSEEGARQRCVAVISTALPSVVPKYDKKPNGSNWTGYVSIEPASSPAEYTRLHMPGATFITDGIRPTDECRTLFGIDAFGNPTYKAVVISEIIDEENAILKSPGFSEAVGSSGSLQQVQIARTLLKDEQATLEAANSDEFSDRFVYNVFADMPLNADVPSQFVAAAVAGLASSVAPHQPITSYTINGFNDQTGSSKRFTPTQLDTMAEGGTLIVTQASGGGANYIRHQLSTDNTDDLRSELSATRNAHSIEEFIEADLKPLVGRYNLTDWFLQLIDVTVRQKLDFLTSNTVTRSAGPQLVSWDPATLLIVQNPVARTEVDIEVDTVQPLPANRIKMKIRVSA